VRSALAARPRLEASSPRSRPNPRGLFPPVVALAVGWLLVNEPLDRWDAAAVLLILTGVVILRSRPPWPAAIALIRAARP